MAQKANLITIRNKYHIELVVENTKLWVALFKLLSNINRLFYIKRVLLKKCFIGVDSSLINFTFFLFYQNATLSKYKRKIDSLSTSCLNMNVRNNSIVNLLKKFSSRYFLNRFLFNIKILNNFVNRKMVFFFYSKLKRYISSLFSRRYNLFIDFLKLTSLFLTQHIDLLNYTKIIGKIFKDLSLRLHNRFVDFIKNLFLMLLEIHKNFNVSSYLEGVKFLLAGRIRGKERSSSKLLTLGRVPIQTLSKNVCFSSTHVYTVYGAFGVKLWVYQKK